MLTISYIINNKKDYNSNNFDFKTVTFKKVKKPRES